MPPKPVRRRRQKSHKMLYASVALLALIVIGVAAYFYIQSTSSVNYIAVAGVAATNPPLVDRNCTFSAFWSSPVNLSGYIFSSNITGQWVNETWKPFTNFTNPTSAWSNVTKFLNFSVGTKIQWLFFANNSQNLWRQTQLQTTKVTSNRVLLITSKGNITIDLYEDMPITTENFRNLVDRGIYDNPTFHRVINNTTPYMIQGGDPTGTGAGDPNIPTIPDELPNKHSNVRGAIAMANKGPNTGSSQFFINTKDNTYLDSAHPVFGEVIIGMDIVDAISNVPRDENDRPLEPVYIIKAMLIRP
ncbi:MAG: peptidylprolyl isomerase [Candidatus Bathyarchaeia archaeon]